MGKLKEDGPKINYIKGNSLEIMGCLWIAAKIFKSKPSEKDPELCNKCEGAKK